MKTKLSQAFALLAIALSIILLIGCATSSKISHADGNHELASGVMPDQLSIPTRVRVLTPKVVYEDARTEAPLAASAFGGAGLEVALVAKALSALAPKGFAQVVSCADVSDLSEEQMTIAEQAGELSNRLFRAHPDPRVLALLRGLAEVDQPVAVLAQYVRVKVGPRGTWDPNTGAITSSASSTVFRAALFDCQTGGRLWDNVVLLRRLPDPDNKDYDKVMELLYSTLTPRPNHRP